MIAIIVKLQASVIAMPNTEEEWLRISAGFERKKGLQNVIGAIDGSLICINWHTNCLIFWTKDILKIKSLDT
jgi:hypothetical protein